MSQLAEIDGCKHCGIDPIGNPMTQNVTADIPETEIRSTNLREYLFPLQNVAQTMDPFSNVVRRSHGITNG